MNGHSGSTLGAERKIGNAWAVVCVRKAWKRKYYLRHIYTCGCLKKEIYTLSEIVCYFGCWHAPAPISSRFPRLLCRPECWWALAGSLPTLDMLQDASLELVCPTAVEHANKRWLPSGTDFFRSCHRDGVGKDGEQGLRAISTHLLLDLISYI